MAAELDPALREYITAHTRPDDELLVTLKAEAARRGFPRIWISPAQASLMRILLGLMGARRVVEVGTLVGYSAIQLARGLPADGEVVSMELDPEHAALARETIARSDVVGRVEVRTGDARELLPQLPANWACAAFIDADKEGYAAYLTECRRIVRPGGLIMVDNACAFGGLLDPAETGPEVEAIRALNDLIADDPALDGVLVPIGDGLWLIRVLNPADR